MSSLRFSAVAVFVLLVASASAAEMYSGGAAACGTAPAAMLFGNSSTTCTKANACQATYCACIGAGAPTAFACGAMTGSSPNCSTTVMCIASKMACINAAADDAASGCSALKDLKMSNLGVAGGQLYSASAGYKACKYEACKMLNQTAQGGNCSMNFAKLCASPVKFVASMLLKGNWAPFLADAAKKAGLIGNFETDLGNHFGHAVKVTKAALKNNRRRRAGDSTLAVTFEVSGVSANNAALQTNLAAAQANSNFLTTTLAAYRTENGATASFTVIGISAGSASSAVFSTSSATSGGASTTSTSGSATSGATTGTTTTTGSSATTTTTGTTTTGSSSASGAATQSLMAAVVVAVLGALLF